MSSQNSERIQLIHELGQAIERMGNVTVLFTHAIASHIGLSATEFECFDKLRESGPVPAGRLAEITGLSTGAITGVVDRLERAGCARREPDPTDRRRVIIHPTGNREMGIKIRKLYEPISQSFNDIVERYDERELAAILDFVTSSTTMTEAYASRLRLRAESQQ